jgi:glycosyltransferase involved in cell wall biosynthesis
MAALALRRHLRARRPDLLHFFLPESYLVGSLAAVIARQRLSLMSRRSLARYQGNHPVLARLERKLHHRTAALIGNSQAVIDELVAEIGDRRKVGLIHNGVEVPPLPGTADRERCRRRLGLPDGAFVMAIVANLIPYKGHADLLAALGAIAPRLPRPWRLLVVGRDEGIGASLREQAKGSGLAEQVIWLGERMDVEAILPAVDLALLVSHEEGFSNALIEAMAQGLPVVATAVGGNLDAIVDGQSGRLVPVGDSGRLGDAILELAWDAAARRRIGAAARERTLALFSRTACLDRYERLYRGFRELGRRPVQAVIDGITEAES